MDEVYFTVESTEIEQDKGKRAGGAADMKNVAIMDESTSLEELETNKNSRMVRYFKAKVLNYHKAQYINKNLQSS